MRVYPDITAATAAVRAISPGVRRLALVGGTQAQFVSSCGRVFSVWRGKKHDTWRVTQLRVMRDGGGYPQVQVKLAGRWRPVRVHQLVAAAFLPPKPLDAKVVRHRDDDPENNHYKNLVWGDQKKNAADAVSNGIKLGRPVVYSDAVVRGVRKARDRGETLSAIADRFGVSRSFVADVVSGRKRKGVL